MSLPEEDEDYKSTFSLDGLPGVDESSDDVDDFDEMDDNHDGAITREEFDATEVGENEAHPAFIRPIPKAGYGALVFLSIFTLFWCAVTFTMTASIVLDAIYVDDAEENWDHHRGIILASGVTETSTDEGDTYCPWIEYQYTIDNVTYTNDQIGYEGRIGQTCASGDYDWADDYPPGENITVYVNPGNPQESIIDTSVDLGLFFFMIPFILAGCFLLWKCGSSIYLAIFDIEKFHEDMSEWRDEDDDYDNS